MKKIIVAALVACVGLWCVPEASAAPRHHKHRVHKVVHHKHVRHKRVMRKRVPAIPCNIFMGPPCWFNNEVRPAKERRAKHTAKVQVFSSAPSFGGDLVSRARAYMGTNPTGWRSLWCARFMAMIAPRAAARIRNPNMARNWAGAGTRLASCRVGAVAVLARGRRGGHVGVVTSCTGRGPVIVSGNHGKRVGEGQYSAARVIAYVAL